MNLEYLPPDLLVEIFSYLKVQDLHFMRMTCKTFKNIIDTNEQFIFKFQIPIATNQISSEFRDRCRCRLTGFEKMRISKNWINGRFKKELLLSSTYNKGSFGNLHLSNDHIWISRGSDICRHRRTQGERYSINVIPDKIECRRSPTSSTVTHFRVKNNRILCGYGDGSMFLKNVQKNKIIFDSSNCHSCGIDCVDISEDCRIIASISPDNLSIWNVNEEYSKDNILKLKYKRELRLRYMFNNFVCLQRYAPVLAFITAETPCSIHFYNLEKMSQLALKSYNETGDYIDDMKWENAHILWTCGDSLRKWDLRINECVQVFKDPNKYYMNCLDLDYYNTIITGTCNDLVLWDVRQKKSVQKYKMNVDSLAFDSQEVYVVNMYGLHMLNFSAQHSNSQE